MNFAWKGARKLVWRAACLTVLAALLGAAAAAAGSAEEYPSRPIRLVVPFAPGGPADFLARLVGQKLGDALGQQLVIDNRPGANTIIGAQIVAKAEPDGYTLLMAIDGTLVMNPFLYSKLPYDPFKDFVPIALLASVPSALVANDKVAARSIREMIDLEKQKPGTFMAGSSTPTSQVAIELLNMMAGVKMAIVPFKGGTTQITAELAGDIPVGMESINVSLPLYRDGKIKILGLTSARRLSFAPDLPTIAETYPGYDLDIWQSIVAPAGTPPVTVARLAAALGKVMAMPDTRERLLAAGVEPAPANTPEQFAAFIRSQAETRAKVIKAVGMRLD
ncbi:MAG TPA: tripartite tricarboxylate transporter substrate binding protein [Xanthobacteraceae bacterium]|nr:tripartite tricarboxylate transporter substrate binding protein [Xanthobacteraceae bacterium]